MLIPRPRINNADLDTLTKNAPVVQLADARGVVRRVVARGGCISDRREALDGREGHALVGPRAGDTGEAQQAVDVVVVGLDARAREDVRLVVPDDLDVGCQRDAAAGLGRALGTRCECSLACSGFVPYRPCERASDLGLLTAAYSMM